MGPDEKQFLVHEDALHQTPVFKAMTIHPFWERESRTILLPEADPDHVDCLFRFLYTGLMDLFSVPARQASALMVIHGSFLHLHALKSTDTDDHQCICCAACGVLVHPSQRICRRIRKGMA